jgi:tetratricopeptide (TPR) repeat protein
MVGVHTSLARSHMLSPDFEGAVQWADRALPLAERLDMLFEIADLLVTRGTALSYVGRVREGIAELQGALLLAESYGLTSTALRARVNLSGALGAEDPDAALRVGLAGLEDVRRTGNRDVLTVIAANVAGMAMHQGRFDVAREALEEALSHDLEAPDRFIVQTVAVIRRVIQGEPYQRMLADATEFAEAWQELNATAQLQSALGWVGLVEGRFADAAAASFDSVASSVGGAAEDLPVGVRAALWAGNAGDARRGLEQLRKFGGHGRMIHAQVTTMAAGIAAVEGQREDAATMYAEAIGHWRALGSIFDLALAELDLVRFVGGERPDVLAAAEDARRTFESIGSPALLRRLDETLGLPVA